MLGHFCINLEQVEEAYEDMVARRVAEYVAQGRQHLLSSALTQVKTLIKSSVSLYVTVTSTFYSVYQHGTT